jgi:REP element-mobilizing transposase RayT
MPLFEKTKIYDHIYRWFDWLYAHDIKVLGFVIMPNHYHMILFLPGEHFSIHKIIGNCKRFIAYEIVKRLKFQKEKMLLRNLTKNIGEREFIKGKIHNVFEPSFDAKVIVTEKFLVQKLNYIHFNPVRGKWKLVEDYRKFEHSSAGFYETLDYTGYPITNYADL